MGTLLHWGAKSINGREKVMKVRRFGPVFTLQLSDELPLLLVDVKADAPVGNHLTRTETDFP